jgi:Protein of unknown function (DUF982)
MNDNNFNRPVRFLANKKIQVILSPKEALAYLQTRWPAGEGVRLRSAQKTLAAVIEQGRPVPDGRRSFVRALQEAGFFLLD